MDYLLGWRFGMEDPRAVGPQLSLHGHKKNVSRTLESRETTHQRATKPHPYDDISAQKRREQDWAIKSGRHHLKDTPTKQSEMLDLANYRRPYLNRSANAFVEFGHKRVPRSIIQDHS
jgi:hypothetical protein